MGRGTWLAERRRAREGVAAAQCPATRGGREGAARRPPRQTGPRGRTVSAGKGAGPALAWPLRVLASLPCLSRPRPDRSAPLIAAGGRWRTPRRPPRSEPGSERHVRLWGRGRRTGLPKPRRAQPCAGRGALGLEAGAPGKERAQRAGPLAAFPAASADAAPGASASVVTKGWKSAGVEDFPFLRAACGQDGIHSPAE